MMQENAFGIAQTQVIPAVQSFYRAADSLFRQGKILRRQNAAVERIADFDRPSLMKVMKNPMLDAAPVVDWHVVRLLVRGVRELLCKLG
jgi:hypothetical protein